MSLSLTPSEASNTIYLNYVNYSVEQSIRMNTPLPREKAPVAAGQIKATTTYLASTNYFNRIGPWFEKLQRIVVVGFFLLIPLVIISETAPAFAWLLYAAPVVLIICVLAWPITDLALDMDNLYHIKKSLIPYFNKTTAYPIFEIKAIRSSGTWKGGWHRFARSEGNSIPNRIEIRFKNGVSQFHDVTIPREILDTVVLTAYELIQHQEAHSS